MRLTARVDTREAFRYLGWSGQEVDADLAARTDRAARLCERFAPAGVFRAFSIESVERDGAGAACAVSLAGTRFALEGRDIAAHLDGAREAVLLAVTLGMESERAIRREQALSATDGLLVDACASSMVESAADDLCRRIAQDAAARGLVPNGRFSPGYGDFALESQRAFVAALGADKAIGVSVTPGCLLVPSKSVTAVVGLFDRERAVRAANTASSAPAEPGALGSARACDTCRMAASCLLRSQGRTCYGRS